MAFRVKVEEITPREDNRYDDAREIFAQRFERLDILKVVLAANGLEPKTDAPFQPAATAPRPRPEPAIFTEEDSGMRARMERVEAALIAINKATPEPEYKDALHHVQQALLALNALQERTGPGTTHL